MGSCLQRDEPGFGNPFLLSPDKQPTGLTWIRYLPPEKINLNLLGERDPTLAS